VNRAEYFNNDLKEYCENEGLKIIAEIPDDRTIAEFYSVGSLIVDEVPKYNELFKNIAENILKFANNKILNNKKVELKKEKFKEAEIIECNIRRNMENVSQIKEIVIISGKGGTGKTSIAASFCALEKRVAIADCDVDAADLHLVLDPKIKNKGFFSGGEIAEIDNQKCILCEECYRECEFDAIDITDKNYFKVDKVLCEGCGVCEIVCKYNAVKLKTAINGEWFKSITRFGPMSHAKLGIAEENSGKLVSLVRNNKNEMANKADINISVIDGSPGTGCPVIASITGTNYAVIVTEPTVSGIHDLKRILDVTSFFNVKSGVIINKYDLNFNKSSEIKRIVEENKHDFLGIIPYTKIMTEAQIKGMSLIEYSKDDKIKKIIFEIWKKIKLHIEYN
jgi:MinD superfamily P-loop ATPase